MADIYDAYPAAAPASPPSAPSPIAASIFDAYPAAAQQPTTAPYQPKPASGALESIQAGFQGSATGLAWRGKLPDLIADPEHSKWWERALTGITQVASELPIMAVGGAGGAIGGGAAGTAIAPGPGTAAGTVLGTGAGMFGLPAAMRQTLIEAYKAGDIKTGADYWNAFKEIAAVTGKEMAIGAATMGAGGIAGRVAGKALAPSIGTTFAAPIEGASKSITGGFARSIEAADIAAQIGTMVTIPAALQGRIPDAQEFLDAAIVIGGLKAAHPIAQKIVDTFVRTGRTPAEQVADAQADPEIAADLRKETPATVNPEMSTRATTLAENRLTELAMKAETDQLTDAERAERVFLANNKAKPERLADYYGLTPDVPVDRLPLSKVDIQDGAQRVYADVLDQLRDVDLARKDAGRTPLGDDHAMAVAALVRARVVARATRLGISPEELYATRRLQIMDDAQNEVKGDTPPEGAPTFTPPEVDLFGNPVEVTNAPRYAVENLGTVEVPLQNLVLSKEVPQFKKDADEQGVIVPLGGSFDRTGVGPIQVWERLDGTMEVISGRHRLDLARRSNEETIPAQIHREADGFTARQAAVLDAMLNIREEQGSVADYVQYFKDAGVTKEAAELDGLLARAKGRAAFAIARDASPDLAAAHRAGLLSDEAALAISNAAPGSERLQALGVAMVNDGKSALVAVNTMKAVELMAAENLAEGKQGDIFGFDDSAMKEAAAMAKKATSIQRRISEQISAVSGASRRPELARKMGVDVADPQGIQNRIKELRQEQYLWDNWPIHPELVERLRSELKQGPNERTVEVAGTRRPITNSDGQIIAPGVHAQMALWKWAADTAAVDAEGRLIRLYHGAKRLDRVGPKINPKRATSGPMPFFTDDPSVATGYTRKADTSLALEDSLQYERWFRVKVPGARSAVDLDRAWWSLTQAERDTIAERAPKISKGYDGSEIQIEEGNTRGTGGYDQHIKEARGNHLKALVEEWLSSGNLYNSEAEFLDVLKLAGMDMTKVEMHDPWAEHPGILPVYMAIKNPLRTDAVTPEVVAALEQAVKRTRRKQLTGADMWEKNRQSAKEWVQALKDDLTTGENSYVWTSIPDRVTQELQKLGYDGIIDTGGKGGGPSHTVYIPFKPTQIKSAVGNRGTFDATDPNILHQAETPAEGAARDREAYEQAVRLDTVTVMQRALEKVGDKTFAELVRLHMEQFADEVLEPAEQAAEIEGVARRVLDGDYDDPGKLFQSKEPFYSELLRQIEAKGSPKASPEQWKATLKNLKGIKADEIKWSGVEEWLDAQEGPVLREAVLDFLRGNGVQVKEVLLGKGSSSEKVGDLREMLRPIESEINLDRSAHDFYLEAERYTNRFDIDGATPESLKGALMELSDYAENLWAGDPPLYIDRYLGDLADMAEGYTNQGAGRTRASLEAMDDAALREEWLAANMLTTAEQVPRERMIAELIHPTPNQIEAGSVPVGAAKFSQYVLPGGENYRELLLTLPEKNNTKVLGHVVEKSNGELLRNGAGDPVIFDNQADIDAMIAQHGGRAIEWASREGDPSAFHSSHFDSANILAHIRFNDRTDADGKRVLFLEEIQSDWAQKGKREGFIGQKSTKEVTQDDDGLWHVLAGGRPVEDATFESEAEARRFIAEGEGSPAGAVHAAPFVQKTEAWTGLALKRMIRYAAEHGYDRIAWTTGEQQVERYTSALRKAVDSIEWKKTQKGVQLIGYKGHQRKVSDELLAAEQVRIDELEPRELDETISRAELRELDALREVRHRTREKVVDTTEQENALSDAIGKAMAEKIIKDPAQEGTIEGDNIRIDSTGMASFYDRILPNVANDLLKKLGGEKVREVNVDTFAAGGKPKEFASVAEAEAYKAGLITTQTGFDVTPTMKAKALEGLPLFQQKQSENRGSYDIAENLITTLEGADRSTVIHELGHSWLEEMKADAARPDAPAQIKADWDILRRELAIPENGTIERTSHEQFARTVERYLMEGEAPSPELAGIFAQFKQWLLDIYKSVMALKVEINPELKGVLDRMLTVEQDAKDAAELNVPRAYVAEARATEAAKIVPPPGVKKQPGFKDEQLALEPYAEELLTGPGSGATNDSRVNAQYINGPMDFKLAIQQMANRDQPNIQAARGGQDGVKSWEQANMEVDRLAEQVMGGKMSDNLFRGDPNAPSHDIQQRYAFRVMMAITQYSLKLRDAILEKGPNATVQDQFDYLSSIVRMRMAHAEFLGLRAASARALNQIRDMTPESGAVEKMIEATAGDGRLFQGEKTPAEQAAELELKLKELMTQHFSGKGALDIAKLHKDIKGLKGNLMLAKEVTDATKWEMVVEGWKAGLLSGPVTHTTNIFGTEAFFSLRPAVDMLAAVIGIARGASPGMGETDRASMSESIARLTGMLSGVKDGVKVFGASFMADEATQKTESYRTAIPGRAGQIIRTPLRLMSAADDMNQTIYRRGELKTLAIRQAFDEQMNPNTRAFSDRVEFLVDNPTPEMAAIADEAGARMSFNAKLGEKGIALQQFVQKWNLQWMIPFIRTPINIAKELARMSPFSPVVGEWRADIKKGGIARDRALAEMALGTGIMALTIGYAFGTDDKGRKLITGAGSPDPGKNRSKAGVEQPYSVLVGDTYYEYARIAPTGTLIGLAADVANVWDHLDDEEKDQIPKMLAVAFSNAVTNQTFLQGITNFVNATSDPTRFAPRFLQQLAASTVPNIIGQPTAMADPVVRQVNSALEAVYARLPGFREQLEPKVDWLAADVKTKERLGIIGPSRTMEVTTDKVRLEAARLELSLADAPKKTHIGKGTGKLGDVELTPEERTKYAKVGGEMAHKILGEIVNAPGYDAIPDLIKKKMFRQVLTASHRIAAVQALPMDKRMAHLSEITERMQQELAPGGEQ